MTTHLRSRNDPFQALRHTDREGRVCGFARSFMVVTHVGSVRPADLKVRWSRVCVLRIFKGVNDGAAKSEP